MKKTALMLAVCSVFSVVLFANGNSEKNAVKSAADLKGKRIGVQAGTTGELYVQENYPSAKIASFKSVIDAAMDLKTGALDAVVLDELPAKEIVAKNSSLMILDTYLSEEEYAIAVKKGNKALLDSINKTIETMKKDGSYNKLIDAFMPADGKIKIPAPPSNPAQGKTVKLGTESAFPPFEYVEGNELVGFDITLSHYIAKTYQAKLETVDMAFDSLIPALASGAIDFIAAGMTVTEERKKNVDFSIPYYKTGLVIMVKK
ncbi:transporter substrate-binding domain-containing protein [Treponema sp. OMZ 840]|uniref:transporter substrate-binding domain-containing protein n=1 Tax=Treponema sp. OMZ 840 TaxID=244313 RepID=UPI003D8AC074